MRQVAAMAGVSLKTVSRVVNDEPRVSPETKERVRAAVIALGFRLNYGASNLKRGASTATVGLIIEDAANPFFSVIARAVEEVARDRRHLLVTASSDEDAGRERELIDTLCSRRIDGLLVVPAGRDHRFLLPEIRMGTPVVFIDRPPGRISADTVLLDNVGGAREATEHLLARGHRRIGVLLDSQGVFTAGPRLEGHAQALREAGLSIDERLLRRNCHDAGAAQAAVADLLDGPDPPTAIFATNNRMSVGALRALADVRPRVALVGFDDFELAELLTPPVTVVAYDLPEMGRRAAELLFDRMAGDARPPRRLIMPTWIVTRGSGEVRPP
jgi:LacI family transcriptional regulator